jgi:hypothetical protein
MSEISGRGREAEEGKQRERSRGRVAEGGQRRKGSGEKAAGKLVEGQSSSILVALPPKSHTSCSA